MPKKLPHIERAVPADVSSAQTRKVDSMSEVMASLLVDADATLPPPPSVPSAASFSAVHFSHRRTAAPIDLDDSGAIPQFRSRFWSLGRAALLLVLLALGAAAGLLMVLLSQS